MGIYLCGFYGWIPSCNICPHCSGILYIFLFEKLLKCVQAGENPWKWYPAGTFGVGFTSFIGEEGAAQDILSSTNMGVLLLTLYPL